MAQRVSIRKPRPQPRFEIPERPPDWEPTLSEDPGRLQGLLNRLVIPTRRAINTAADVMFGSTPEEQAENAIMGTVGVMIPGSPLRLPAYRERMLRALSEQIDAMEPSMARTMFRRLIETHPRVMSAFQHSGGTLQRDPAYTPEVVKEAISESLAPTHFGRFTPGESELVPDLRGVYRDPSISITPESLIGTIDPTSVSHGVSNIPGIDQAGTAAHEMTHWAQNLGGRDSKRRVEVIDELTEMANRGATVGEALPLQLEQRVLSNILEQGADRAGVRQSARMKAALEKAGEDLDRAIGRDPAYTIERSIPGERPKRRSSWPRRLLDFLR